MELKKNWLLYAAIAAAVFYIYKQQQNKASMSAPAAGGTP